MEKCRLQPKGGLGNFPLCRHTRLYLTRLFSLFKYFFDYGTVFSAFVPLPQSFNTLFKTYGFMFEGNIVVCDFWTGMSRLKNLLLDGIDSSNIATTCYVVKGSHRPL